MQSQYMDFAEFSVGVYAKQGLFNYLNPLKIGA